MITLRYRTLVAFFAGIAITLTATIVFHAWRADAAQGDNEATFVPITPCRLIDTRPAPARIGPHAAFGIDDTRTLQAHGTNGDCTIPADAVGLSLNVTAVGATTPTFLTVWPDNTRPNASSLNPYPGEPATPNAVVTDLSDTGSFKVYNLAGHVNVIIDVNGYHTNTSLAALLALTASMSLSDVDGQPTIRFTGVNVQIVDGSGNTWDEVNGRGNLIIGYNERSGPDRRTGSHNLVIGPKHTYSSYGGLVAGHNNNVTGSYSSVTGGEDNIASGHDSSVTGGFGNTARGTHSSVTGGWSNHTVGWYASVSGGKHNTADGEASSVSGGVNSWASGEESSVSGGIANRASGDHSSVSGGHNNTATGDSSSVTGGSDNRANNTTSSVTGGHNNAAGGVASSVSGGFDNGPTGEHSSVSGGTNNTASGAAASVTGGNSVTCSIDYSVC